MTLPSALDAAIAVMVTLTDALGAFAWGLGTAAAVVDLAVSFPLRLLGVVP